LRELAASLMPWMLFSVGGEPFVNGADIKRIVSGVVWTLANEWLFYLSLPFLAWFARKSKRLLHLAGMFLVIFALSKVLSSARIHQEWIVSFFLIIREFAKFMLIGFGGGILVANFQDKLVQRVTLSSSARNWLLLVIYILYLFSPPFRGFFAAGIPVLLLGFTLVVLGSDLFGFITSQPVRFLGIISYDLYLLHGINYYIAMLLRGGIHPVTLRSYLLQTAVCLTSIILTSTLFHFLVERPSMKLSEKIARNPSANRAPGLLKPETEGVAAG
jgi:peptidoglycan/LPS O-acetylase OafA/YrhL